MIRRHGRVCPPDLIPRFTKPVTKIVFTMPSKFDTMNFRDIIYAYQPDPRKRYSREDLELFTNNFKHCIGTFQLGKVYRGKVESCPVVVKVWEEYEHFCPDIEELENFAKLKRELRFHEKAGMDHPNLIKLKGYCIEDDLIASVYDFDAMGTLENIIVTDAFTWKQRIKVAIQIASALAYIHGKSDADNPYMLANLDANNVLLDKEYNPVLYDFAMISGGIFPQQWLKFCPLYGGFRHTEPCYFVWGSVNSLFCRLVRKVIIGRRIWSTKTDVFAFGIILLNLLTRRVDYGGLKDIEALWHERPPFLHETAREEYKEKTTIRLGKFKLGHALSESWFARCLARSWFVRVLTGSVPSLVDKSLVSSLDFHRMDAYHLTKLAIQCVESWGEDRPTMSEAVARLLKLRVARSDAKLVA